MKPSCFRMGAIASSSATLLFLSAAFLAPYGSQAQSKTPPTMLRAQGTPSAAMYDSHRETIVQGSVISFTTDSVAPPLGTHVLVRTTSGTLDVHLGSSRVLSQTKIELAPGDTVRLVGENIVLRNGSSFFAARILQKGAQAATLRNKKGIPVKAIPHDAQTVAALRGVR